MESRRGIPINVSVNPSDYSGRSIRLGGGSIDMRDKMNQRMREFEEESRKWRDQFLSSPTAIDSPNRPRMFFNYPEFPELSMTSPFSSSARSTGFGSPFSSPIAPFAQSSHKSFMEEDDLGNKKYKIQFDIGDFKPSEIQVRTEGRQLVVKGDREIKAGGSSESKQFNREITLPDFIEPTSVTSYLTDGVLIVEAPVQLDRLGYTPAAAVTNSSTSSSSSQQQSSNLRNSPYRDTQSPSRVNHLQSSSSSQSSSNTQQRNNAYGQQSSSTVGAAAAGGASPFYSSINEPSFTSSVSPAVSAGAAPLTVYKFNMSEFRPEDIAITVTDTTLKVHAVREESDPRGAEKTYREFKREVGLPQGADVKRLKNSLQPDGTLTIEIPVVDNAAMRPQYSPASINKQFSNFSLNDSNNNQTSSSIQQPSTILSSSGLAQQQQAPPQSPGLGNGGLINTTNDGKDLRLTFDLAGYKPEDLGIKVIDNNTLKIHAVHIDNTRGNQIHREYTRSYQLPDWVQPELLRARMSDNGTLTVEVPMPQAQPSKYEQMINIHH